MIKNYEHNLFYNKTRPIKLTRDERFLMFMKHNLKKNYGKSSFNLVVKYISFLNLFSCPFINEY